MFKILKSALTIAAVVAVLFFGGIGIAALVTHQDYTVVMNVVFDWIKGLSNT